MNSWVDYYGKYETTRTIVGVTFVYKRVADHSTITIAGKLVIFFSFIFATRTASPKYHILIIVGPYYQTHPVIFSLWVGEIQST